MKRSGDTLVLCDQCGQPHHWLPIAPNQISRCTRCDAMIGRGHILSVTTVLALTTAAGAVWLLAISLPLLSLSLRGSAEGTTLPDAVVSAWQSGQPIVAAVAAITALIAPALYIALRLYVLAPLAAGRRPPGFAWCVRVLHQAARWNMIEVFTLGVLLSLVRLAGVADTSPGPGLFALGAVTLLFAAIESAGLKHLWWYVE